MTTNSSSSLFLKKRSSSLVCLLAFAWTLWRGQDINWDLQNYHYYDAFALLHWRWNADVGPGGPQSFLNPLPYLVPYAVWRLLPPLAGSMVITATQLMPLLLAWTIAWRGFGCFGNKPGRGWAAAAAAVAAGTGAAVLLELGTSFCDLVLAAPALLAVLLLLPLPHGAAPPAWRLALAGASAGAAVGLKPINLFLLPALAAGVAASRPQPASLAGRIRLLAIAGLGALAGILVFGGWWSFLLWRDYGSPLFPFVNTVFHAPSAAAVDFTATRYRWRGAAHALMLPFALARGTAATCEVPLRDVRFAVALPLAAWALLPGFWRPSSAIRILAAWLVAGTAFWMLLCPTQRFAVSLEMLAAVFIVLVAADAAPARFRAAAAVAVAAVLALTTRTADFFHRPWSQAFVAQVPEDVPAGATYAMLDKPLAYWVAVPPRPAHAFTLNPELLTTGGTLQRRLDRIIQGAPDRLVTVAFDTVTDAMTRAEMSIHGIVQAPPCARTQSPIGLTTVFCRGAVVGPRQDAAADLAAGTPVRFDSQGIGLIYEIAGWGVTEPDGTGADSATARLAFRPVPDPSEAPPGGGPVPVVVSLKIAGVAGAPPQTVRAEAGGGATSVWKLDRPGQIEVHLCAGPQRGQGGVLEVHFDSDDTRSLREPGVSPEPRHLAFKIFAMSWRPAARGACVGA
jgi:hypothetical protein